MNVGYQYKCNNCEKEGKFRAYDGETYRNLYNRHKEHARDFKSINNPNCMRKHVDKEHDVKAENVKFDVKITGKFTKPLSRQIDEANRIFNKQPEENLNYKYEFNSQQTKKLVIESRGEVTCDSCSKRNREKDKDKGNRK